MQYLSPPLSTHFMRYLDRFVVISIVTLGRLFSFLTNRPENWTRMYHQSLCLEAWYINCAHVPLNRDAGDLLPATYIHVIKRKGL